MWSAPKQAKTICLDSRKWIVLSHTKAIKCLHLDSNSQRVSLLRHPNGLSNPFQSGSCQKKSCSASQTGLCVSGVDLAFSAWMEEGGVAKSPAGTQGSGLPCELSELQWAWATLPRSGQTSTAHCLLMKSPCWVLSFHRLQVPWGFTGLVCIHTSQIMLRRSFKVKQTCENV